jgi:hypothetical protein
MKVIRQGREGKRGRDLVKRVEVSFPVALV